MLRATCAREISRLEGCLVTKSPGNNYILLKLSRNKVLKKNLIWRYITIESGILYRALLSLLFQKKTITYLLGQGENSPVFLAFGDV